MAVHYKKALDAMQAGESLMFTHADPRRESDKSFYSLIPSGETVHPLAVRKMRDRVIKAILESSPEAIAELQAAKLIK